jgi:monoamine oxidase
VGGGVSGIQAADILTQKSDLKVLILEAQSTLGGRIGSIHLSGMEQVKKSKWAWENFSKINEAIV